MVSKSIASGRRVFSGFTLLIVLLSSPGSRAKTELGPKEIYGSIQEAQSCLDITWRIATSSLQFALLPSYSPNCLRFAFHDAGSYLNATDQGGANGSIMLELDPTQFPENSGLTECGELMPIIIESVRRNGCPSITAADAIQITGAAAVVLNMGPTCPLLMGRPDKSTPDDLSSLPGKPCHDAVQMVDSFVKMGFEDPVEAVVVLVGAHTIGKSRATTGNCSKGLGPMTAHPNKFDGHYYNEVVEQTGKKGFFFSDRAMNEPGAATADLMQRYARNNTEWIVDWCKFYQEMSLLGVDPGPAGFSVSDGWMPSGGSTSDDAGHKPLPPLGKPLVKPLAGPVPDPSMMSKLMASLAAAFSSGVAPGPLPGVGEGGPFPDAEGPIPV